MGNCLAGETCIFSHDPSNLVSRFTIDSSPSSTPQPNAFYLSSQDATTFPALNPDVEPWPAPGSQPGSHPGSFRGSGYMRTPPQGYRQPHLGDFSNQKPHSRPPSRHQAR